MYKVFIDEKTLLLSEDKVELEKTYLYKDKVTLEMAIDRLKNTSCTEINVYHTDIEMIWKNFKSLFKNIDAAGGIVSNKNGELLFIERLGRWDLPKGKAEKGETIEETALREVEEETGIDQLLLNRFIGCTYHTYATSKHTVLKTTYWYDLSYKGNKLGIPQAEEGITAIDWKNKTEIISQVFNNTFENIKLILSKYWQANKNN